MNMKISSIQIKCKTRNIFVQLSNSIYFVYGNAGVGKTTLLNLINYGLGNDLLKTLAVEREVLGVCLNILINGELVCLERKMNSNSILMTKNNERINLCAKSIKNSQLQSFSDFIYLFEGIQPIVMLRKNSSKEIKVNFSNFMWFSYLKQEELDNTLFYLGDQNNNFKAIASNYVMKVLLGEKEVSDKEINKEINILKERQENIKLRLSIVPELSSATKLFDINLSEEIVKKQKEILNIREKIKVEKQKLIERKSPIDPSLLEDVLDMQERQGIYKAEIRYLAEFGKINDIRNNYVADLKRCEEKILYYNAIKNDTSNSSFENNIDKLENIFLKCLIDVGFSYIETSDFVKIDNKSFVPSIFSKYGEFKFDYFNLSSGGKKTIFKICYALAIHIYVVENGVHSILPQFIIIDTPMKNISEREDRVLFENLYHYFITLFSYGGKLENIQLIIVDKELPQVFEENEIMYKHITNNEPLIPKLDEVMF